MNKKDALKSKMIEALTQCKGNVSNACKSVNVARGTHYKWLNEDQEYKASCDAIVDIAIDYVEDKLFERIESGDTTATIFYLKTIGKRRGYVEKREHDHTTKGESLNKQRDLSKLTDEELKQMAAIEAKLNA